MFLPNNRELKEPRLSELRRMLNFNGQTYLSSAH